MPLHCFEHLLARQREHARLEVGVPLHRAAVVHVILDLADERTHAHGEKAEEAEGLG